MTNRDPQEERARIEYGMFLMMYIDAFSDDNINELYPRILSELHNIPFVCRVKLDENRVEDALGMRRFVIQNSADYLYYNATFPNPSVLEVLCAFAKLCWESDGQSDQRYPSDWLRMFFMNMNLIDDICNEISENPTYIRIQVDTMMDRRYDRNGEHGGLFHIRRSDVDMRRIQLFEQMDVYLGELDSE